MFPKQKRCLWAVSEFQGSKTTSFLIWYYLCFQGKMCSAAHVLWKWKKFWEHEDQQQHVDESNDTFYCYTVTRGRGSYSQIIQLCWSWKRGWTSSVMLDWLSEPSESCLLDSRLSDATHVSFTPMTMSWRTFRGQYLPRNRPPACLACSYNQAQKREKEREKLTSDYLKIHLKCIKFPGGEKCVQQLQDARKWKK